MKKQELREKINKSEVEVSENYPHEYVIEKQLVLNLIDQLEEPQPELPVIPKFVADYIEQSQGEGEGLNQAFAFIDDKEDKELWNWMFPTMTKIKRDNQDLFARAWLDGFLIDGNKEEWKSIEGFHNEVSNLGRVKSVGHKAGNEKFYKGKVLKPIVTESGYVNVSLVSKDGGKVIKRVHRLVAENFIDNKEGKPEVNHIDGDKENNSAVNLEWVTSSENKVHAYKEGLHIPLKGTEKHFAKLTERDVVDIRKEYREGCLQAEIAEKYGVARQTISSVVNNKAWKHVIDEFAEEITK